MKEPLQAADSEKATEETAEECPYLERSHSTARLSYFCKAVVPPAEIEPGGSESTRCRQSYFGCPRYRERKI